MWTVESHPILTKRELLAAIAMHALTVQEHTLLSPKECARGAINRADELIEALAGKEQVIRAPEILPDCRTCQHHRITPIAGTHWCALRPPLVCINGDAHVLVESVRLYQTEQKQ